MISADSVAAGWAAAENSLPTRPPFLETFRHKVHTGVVKDFYARWPLYISDWRDGLDWTVLSASAFIFFTSILPGVTFGVYLHNGTEGALSAVEVLFSTAIGGAIYAVFAGQPLTIVGVTGPLSILTVTIHRMSAAFNWPFLPFLGWTCFWSGLMHIFLAFYRVCDLVNSVTRFSCEIFGCLIGIIYLITALLDILHYFSSTAYSYEIGFFSILLSWLVFYLCIEFHHARRWNLFNHRVRGFLADYGTVIAILTGTWIAHWNIFSPLLDPKRVEHDRLPLLDLPDSFRPSTMSGRLSSLPWLVDFSLLPAGGIFFSILPAILLTALFFFDHNISSILAQQNHFHLKKPPAYHWDFLILGFLVLLGGFLGIPPVNGLIPQAPLHSKALSKYRIKEKKKKNEEEKASVSTNENSSEIQLECIGVVENRLSNLGQSIAIGLSLLVLPALGQMPRAALTGLFAYMGYTSFLQNQFADRIYFFFCDRTRVKGFLLAARRPAAGPSPLGPPGPLGEENSFQPRPSTPPPISLKQIHRFTAIQLACLLLIYLITWTPLEATFPIFIVLLIPIRKYILPNYFPSGEIDFLDSPEEHPEWKTTMILEQNHTPGERISVSGVEFSLPQNPISHEDREEIPHLQEDIENAAAKKDHQWGDEEETQPLEQQEAEDEKDESFHPF